VSAEQEAEWTPKPVRPWRRKKYSCNCRKSNTDRSTCSESFHWVSCRD